METGGATSKNAARTGINEPGVVNTLYGPARELHSSHRAGSEACQGQGQGGWCLGKERVEAVSTEDILVHGKREARIKYCSGRLAATQKVCPALPSFRGLGEKDKANRQSKQGS